MSLLVEHDSYGFDKVLFHEGDVLHRVHELSFTVPYPLLEFNDGVPGALELGFQLLHLGLQAQDLVCQGPGSHLDGVSLIMRLLISSD